MKTDVIKYPHTVTTTTDNRGQVIAIMIDRGAGRKPEVLDLASPSERTFRGIAIRQADVIRKLTKTIADYTLLSESDVLTSAVGSGVAQAQADLERVSRET